MLFKRYRELYKIRLYPIYFFTNRKTNINLQQMQNDYKIEQRALTKKNTHTQTITSIKL
jgi:hypothetical protein